MRGSREIGREKSRLFERESQVEQHTLCREVSEFMPQKDSREREREFECEKIPHSSRERGGPVAGEDEGGGRRKKKTQKTWKLEGGICSSTKRVHGFALPRFLLLAVFLLL